MRAVRSQLAPIVIQLEIAAARHIFDLSTLPYCDASARIVDQTFLPHVEGHACDARPIYAQRSGDLFVCKLKELSSRAILQHQQPCTKTLLHRMIHIAYRLLRDLANI